MNQGAGAVRVKRHDGGFLLLVGVSQRARREPARSGDTCLQCGRAAAEVVSTRSWFTLFFIPLFPLSKARRAGRCAVCLAGDGGSAAPAPEPREAVEGVVAAPDLRNDWRAAVYGREASWRHWSRALRRLLFSAEEPAFRECLEEARKRFGAEPGPGLYALRAALWKRAWEDAGTAAAALFAQFPYQGEGHLLHARALAEQGQRAQALEAARMALQCGHPLARRVQQGIIRADLDEFPVDDLVREVIKRENF